MTAATALRDGMRRVGRAPAVLAGVWLITLLAAMPLALQVRDGLAADLGSSLAAADAADGGTGDWLSELRTPLTPGASVIGFAAVLRNASDFMDAKAQSAGVGAAAAGYLLVWTFLAGGMIDRFARQRPTRAYGFFSACGVYFFRFLRLALIAGPIYYALFRWLHPLLFEDLFPWATRDMAAERNAFVVRVFLYALFGVVLALTQLLFDYAKVRAVVEDRRSMLGAVLASARFIRRHFGRVLALYVLVAILLVVVMALYGLVAPGAGRAGLHAWWAFLLGQAYVAARLAMKLLGYAAETAFFQGELAHAEYAAAPPPVWPESPSAEALANTRV